MNIFDQLNMITSSPRKKRACRVYHQPHLIQQIAAEERYRAILYGAKVATGDIANRLGISHMGCLTTLYKLEKRGRIRRAGIIARKDHEPKGRGQILWTWNDAS